MSGYMAKGRHGGQGHRIPEFTPEEWEQIKTDALDPTSLTARLLGMATWQRVTLAMEIMD